MLHPWPTPPPKADLPFPKLSHPTFSSVSINRLSNRWFSFMQVPPHPQHFTFPLHQLVLFSDFVFWGPTSPVRCSECSYKPERQTLSSRVHPFALSPSPIHVKSPPFLQFGRVRPAKKGVYSLSSSFFLFPRLVLAPRHRSPA